MNKRQRKKYRKKAAILNYKESGNDLLHCEQCGRKLDVLDDYQWRYGTCNSYCYGKLVGIYF